MNRTDAAVVDDGGGAGSRPSWSDGVEYVATIDAIAEPVDPPSHAELLDAWRALNEVEEESPWPLPPISPKVERLSLQDLRTYISEELHRAAMSRLNEWHRRQRWFDKLQSEVGQKCAAILEGDWFGKPSVMPLPVMSGKTIREWLRLAARSAERDYWRPIERDRSDAALVPGHGKEAKHTDPTGDMVADHMDRMHTGPGSIPNLNEGLERLFRLSPSDPDLVSPALAARRHQEGGRKASSLATQRVLTFMTTQQSVNWLSLWLEDGERRGKGNPLAKQAGDHKLDLAVTRALKAVHPKASDKMAERCKADVLHSLLVIVRQAETAAIRQAETAAPNQASKLKPLVFTYLVDLVLHASVYRVGQLLLNPLVETSHEAGADEQVAASVSWADDLIFELSNREPFERKLVRPSLAAGVDAYLGWIAKKVGSNNMVDLRHDLEVFLDGHINRDALVAANLRFFDMAVERQKELSSRD